MMKGKLMISLDATTFSSTVMVSSVCVYASAWNWPIVSLVHSTACDGAGVENSGLACEIPTRTQVTTTPNWLAHELVTVARIPKTIYGWPCLQQGSRAAAEYTGVR